ncbi:FecCD family ABC transporter permease [Nesterenkonia populi]
MWLVLAAALLGLCVVSVAVGARDIPLGTVMDAVRSITVETAAAPEELIIHQTRIPRTLAGLVVGAALGTAGALIQALTRNPLADPGILGVNAGAAFAVALGIGVFGVSSIGGYVWFGFGGAFIVTFGVYAIAASGRGPVDPIRVTLAGVALGAVLTGLTTGLTLLDSQTFDQMRFWAAGSLAGRQTEMIVTVLPFLVLGLVIALWCTGALNAIALGDDVATALGARIGLTRALVVLAVTLLAGTATALAGPIGFVGLMIPHVARWITGPDQRWIFAYTLVLAPLLLLTSDVLGRLITRPGEVPVGIVTALVGAPVMILLVRRRKASML